jgi:hypothetical protein
MSAVSLTPTCVVWPDLRGALRVAALLCTLAGAVALTVVVLGREAARELLGFGFRPLPRTVGEAASILLNNARVLGGVLIACYVAQLASAGAPWLRAMRHLCDAVLVAMAAVHVLLVGAGIGAYGTRMIISLLPYGPFELGAFSVALSLYVAARREPLAPRRWLASGGAAVVLLAIAAPLEVFVA